ncbi:MAG: fumarate hydratase [Firmicutes bacterium]|nr:fumarate hydratase [Bacillota bacterium]
MSKLRFIDAAVITQAVADLCVDANICIGADMYAALKTAHGAELSQLAKSALQDLLQNADIAQKEKLALCQDTGMAVVFISIGDTVHVQGNIEDAVNEGVRQGYHKGYFRSSVVSDPIKRTNTQDNTPAVIYYDFLQGDTLKITVAPKGFGSENMSALKMLMPSDGIEGVEEFVVQTVKAAGANPCPPIVVGVGVGGTMEKAALLAKQALLRDIGTPHPNPFWAEFELRTLSRINALGIGAAGFGGKTTALGVHVLPYPTHIAGLPVAVNIGCHATRHKTKEI